MIKELIQQEDITTANICASNIGAPKHIKHTLRDLKGETDSNRILRNFNAPLSTKDIQA